jgi:hypothetical protein
MLSRGHIRKIGRLFCLLFVVSFFPVGAIRQAPVKVTLCQLKSDPAAYNHKLVEVTAFVSHGFEDFTLFDPSCSSWPEVWLEYGGVAASGTMYCCGVTAERRRPKQLVVENLAISLIDDERFRDFDKLVQRKPDSVAHATLVGRFFSGSEVKHADGGVSFEGYGHMGCCSLLGIEQVMLVDPQDRKDLDYSASADQPAIDKAGCSYRDLLPIRASADLIETLKRAEAGQREWVVDDPQRVASDSLARLLNIDEKSITGITQTRKAQGRVVYEWRARGKVLNYMIVISRPYWLSFYATDAKRIPWVAIGAYESSCGRR